MTPFFVTALPRSGTTFLANFFTHSGVFCWHEATCGCADMTEFERRMKVPDYYRVGDSDSALPLAYDGIRLAFPGAYWVGVDRDPGHVAAALKVAGGWPGEERFEALVAAHRRALAGCDMVVAFPDLFLTETLRNMWHNVTGLRFDARRADMLSRIRVEPNLERYWPRYHAHQRLEEQRT